MKGKGVCEASLIAMPWGFVTVLHGAGSTFSREPLACDVVSTRLGCLHLLLRFEPL